MLTHAEANHCETLMYTLISQLNIEIVKILKMFTDQQPGYNKQFPRVSVLSRLSFMHSYSGVLLCLSVTHLVSPSAQFEVFNTLGSTEAGQLLRCVLSHTRGKS